MNLVEIALFTVTAAQDRVDETAAALGISRATVDREWQAARAWLYRRISHTADGNDT